MRGSARAWLSRAPRTFLVGVSMLVVGLGGGLLGGAALAGPGDDETFFACLNEFTGALLRVNTRSAPKCGWAERSVRWSQQGQTGPTGPAGPQGPSGATTIQSVPSYPTVDGGQTGRVEVACPDGFVATGGGFYAPSDRFDVNYSMPVPPQAGNPMPTAWQVEVRNKTTDVHAFGAIVMCAAP